MRNIGNQRTNNKHDKTFKIVLENKEEVANLINRVIECKIMLLEKSKSSEELIENLEEINPKLKSEEKETLKRILIYALEEYLEEEKLEQIINKMNKGGEEEMLAMVEMLKREKQTDIARGKSEGAAQRTVKLAKRMLKEKLDIEMIEKITGLKREKFM